MSTESSAGETSGSAHTPPLEHAAPPAGARGPSGRVWLARCLVVACHSVAVVGLAAGVVWWWSSSALRSSAILWLQNGVGIWPTAGRLGVHLALVAGGWFVCALLIRGARRRYRRATGTSSARAWPRRSGTVVVETLVVLPVALMLITGLMQLVVNNMAALSTRFAAYEASRTVWLWEGEQGAASEGEIDEETLARYARVQAASVLAPVAPGGFHMEGAVLYGRVDRARRMFLAANLPVPFHDSGAAVEDPGHVYTRTAGRHGAPKNLSVARALDPYVMPVKTGRKFTWAFFATSVDIDGIEKTRDLQRRPERVEVTLTYEHLCAFPFVAMLFGEVKNVHGRRGYYHDIEHDVSRRRQLPASAAWPKWEGGGGIERPIDYH